VEWSELGQRGDFLSGHLGSAANAAGFLLLCAATIVQMRELARQERTDQDQQRSIDATLQALKDQATALSRQVDASIAQVGELREQTNKFEQLVNAMKDSRDYGRVLEMIRDRDGLLELIRTKAIDKQDGQRRVEAYESAIQAYTRKAVAHEIRPFLKMAGIDEN
jgi:chromosome segregation ATPase